MLDLVLAGKLQMAVSEPILTEYEGVLRRPRFGIKPRQVSQSIRLIRKAARILSPRRELTVTRDPADNRFLECAEASKADYLVTGNKCHFPRVAADAGRERTGIAGMDYRRAAAMTSARHSQRTKEVRQIVLSSACDPEHHIDHPDSVSCSNMARCDRYRSASNHACRI